MPLSLLIILSSYSVIIFAEQLNQIGIETFQNSLLRIRDNDLKVSQFQDHVNNQVSLEEVSLLPSSVATDVIEVVSAKISKRVDALNRLHNIIQKTYLEGNQWGQWLNCCMLNDNSTSYNSDYFDKVDMQQICSVASSSAIQIHKIPNYEFLKTAKENLVRYPGLKWQYFGSETGILTQYPASKFCSSVNNKNNSSGETGYDNRFRPWYVRAITPTAKDIVLVIDRSASMRKFNRMESTIEAAVTVLNTLNPDDRVAVVTFSDQAYALGSAAAELAVSSTDSNLIIIDLTNENACFNSTMASATPSNILHLSNMVSKIVPHGDTYYAKALLIAFDFLQEAFNRDKVQAGNEIPKNVAHARERAILFLSDGEPSDLPYSIFKLIHDRNKQMYNSVVLLCFALGKSTFGSALKRMASQDFGFPNEDASDCTEFCNLPDPPRGMFKHVRETKNLRTAMGFYYNFFYAHKKSPSPFSVEWSVPYLDMGGLGMVITAASAVVINDELIGVAGVDLSLHELLADISYFRSAGDSAYAFIVDITGRTIMHPFQPHPNTVTQHPILTDISAYERTHDVQEFLKSTLKSIAANRGPTGEILQENDVFVKTFNITRVHPTVHQNVLTYESTSKYVCSALSFTTFLLCVVVEDNLEGVSILSSQTIPSGFDFLYHRLDFLPSSLLCRRQEQAITTTSSVVMFSPVAFTDSGKYIVTQESKKIVEKYDNYMRSGRYSTPTKIFKDNVRNAVLASWILDDLWKSGDQPRNVAWRYFGSEQGIFRIYPGVKMAKLYNPLRRPWYGEAHALLFEYFADHLSDNGSFSQDTGTAVSPPYLDANGAGLVITVSSAITTAEHRGSLSQFRHILGVMGADIYLSFFQQLVKDAFSECRSTEDPHSCIAIDISGFVIYDQILASGNTEAIKQAEASNYHLMHNHTAVARVLIDKRILLHHRCVDISQASYKTSYHLDLDRINEVTGIPFLISYIPNSNVIIIALPSAFNDEQNAANSNCAIHSHSNEACIHSTTASGFMDQCESECVDEHDDPTQYSTCSNLYNYTWDSAPPPCEPGHEDINPSKGFEESKVEIELAPLAWCSPQFLHPSYQSQDHPMNNHSGTVFAVFVCICCVLLLSIWVGLNRRRIRNHCPRIVM